jgi:hypothetical protein
VCKRALQIERVDFKVKVIALIPWSRYLVCLQRVVSELHLCCAATAEVCCSLAHQCIIATCSRQFQQSGRVERESQKLIDALVPQ